MKLTRFYTYWMRGEFPFSYMDHILCSKKTAEFFPETEDAATCTLTISKTEKPGYIQIQDMKIVYDDEGDIEEHQVQVRGEWYGVYQALWEALDLGDWVHVGV